MAKGRKDTKSQIFRDFISIEENRIAVLKAKSYSSIYDNEFADWCEKTGNSLSIPPFNKMVREWKASIPKEEFEKINQSIEEDNTQYKQVKIHYKEVYEMIEAYTKMCHRGAYHSLIVHGTSGVGKSHTVRETLHKAVLEGGVDKNGNPLKEPVHLGGAIKSTRDLAWLLYQYRDDFVIVLDDLDIKGTEMKNILKKALEDSDNRYVTYVDNAKVPKDEKIPNVFEFTSRIIFLTNMRRLDSALKDRGAVVKVDFSKEEILMKIKDELKTFLPAVPMEIKQEVWDFLMENKSKLKDVSFRKFKVAVMNRGVAPTKWKDWTFHGLNS